MAHGQYIGVNGVARKVAHQFIGVSGVARKVKNGFIGVGGVARMFLGEQLLSKADLSKYFAITEDAYTFNSNASNIFSPTNIGVNSSTATMTLSPIGSVNLRIEYDIITEYNYDKFTIKNGGTTVINAISGTKSGTVNISVTGALSFIYSKDSSGHASGEKVEVKIYLV